MLRALACMAVTAAGAGLGWWMGERCRTRAAQLEACDLLLARLQSRLTAERLTTRELLLQGAESPRLSGLPFLSLAAEGLSQGTPFPQAWAQALTASRSSLALAGEDWTPLEALGEILGAAEGERQAEELGLLRELLGERIADAREQCRVKGKLSDSLGFLGGAALGILLI